MSFRREHIFTGLIDGKNITQQKLDYSVVGVEQRIDNIQKILEQYDYFLMEYFDNYFCSNASKYNKLALNNNICNKLDTFSDYILTQVPKEDKLEYKFYSDYRDFEREINKELNLEMVIDNKDGDNILHYLIESGKNYKKCKDIVLSENDFLRHDYVGQLLNQYKAYKDILSDLKKNGTTIQKYYANKNISLVTKDMIYCKENLDGIFGTNLRNGLKDSEKPSFDDIDFFNLHHIECLLKSTKSELNFDEDYSMHLNYFNDLFKKIYNELSQKEKEICTVIRWGNSSVTQVNDTLKIGYETNNVKELYQVDSDELKRTIYKICKKICNEHKKSLQSFLDLNYHKGNYIQYVKTKKCSKCGNVIPLSNFWNRELGKDGKMNICKDCFKK